MKKIAFAAAVAALSATPAFAQDEAKPTTFYVGPVVGYDNIKLSDGTDSESDDGVMYGVVAGVDYQVNNSFFLGVEGEFADSEVGESVSNIVYAGDEARVEAGRSLYIGARAGTQIGGAKFYVKGGYINARINAEYDDTVDVYKGHEDLDGWLVGVGAEAKLSPVVLRLEYRYSDYGDVNIAGLNTGIDASRHQVVAGALFSF